MTKENLLNIKQFGERKLNQKKLMEYNNVPELKQVFNQWLSKELASFYLYEIFSAKADLNGYFGTSKYFKKQSQEEFTHYGKVKDFIMGFFNDIGYMDIPIPTNIINPSRLPSYFEVGFTHEQTVSQAILTVKETVTTMGVKNIDKILDEFLLEQVEEEDKFGTILDRLRISPDNTTSWLIIDAELGE